ncbi:MAG: DUF389 domain-containing protein [Bacteroidales bacterium]|nr:DUF389 domain-containing protein [Bacteroidales bacterium]
MGINIRNLGKSLKRYFNLVSDKEDERQVVEQVSAGVEFRGTNLWILMCAIMIASLGLNVNSTAVIIGAMLISPLMGPIIGMGLGVGIGDYDLLKRALKNYGVATLISVVTATVYFLISPLSEARSELLARTSPSLYDVLIAFFGGAAGVLALTTKSKGQVIPGVAIATALMPPLCTAGYGLATAQWSYFFGAFYLFFINTVFIAVATFLGVKLLRFHSQSTLAPERLQYGRRVITVILVATLIPAAVMTVSIVRKDIFERNVASFVERELHQTGTQIIGREVVHDTLRVVAVGRNITETEMAAARSRMGYYSLGAYALDVIQGADNSQYLSLVNQQSSLNGQLASLSAQLSSYTQYDTLSARLADEVAPLFPAVESVAVGRVGDGIVALVALADELEAEQQERLVEWLRARTRQPGLDVVIRR